MDINSITRKFKSFKYFIKSSYIISYPHIEFETKIQTARWSLVVNEILNNLKKNSIKLDEVTKRYEIHHLYKKGNIHRTFIFMRGSKNVWIKEKWPAQVFYTPTLGVPILIRYEKKLKPSDRLYQKLFCETLYWHYAGSFQKECVDVSFWFGDFFSR